MASNANQVYFDAALRHQIGVKRFASGEVKRILLLLEKADRDLARQLRAGLRKTRGLTGVERRFVVKRLSNLLKDIRAARRAVMLELRRRLGSTLVDLAQTEVGFEQRMLTSAIPVQIEFAAVSLATLREVVFQRPFQGRLLREWFTSLENADQLRLTEAIQLGVAEQESIDNIVRRVAGTRANRFRDGIIAITRRNAESVVRTAVNHVSNQARETLWDANADIIQALRWASTLDGRTTPICMARDGRLAPVGAKPLPEGALLLSPPGARPPAHVSCRSIMVAVLDGAGIVGDRPFVTDTRTPGGREVDFRRMAKEQGRSIAEVRRRWTEQNIGTVPAVTTYDSWLRRQSAAFQDEVLGPKRGILFRRGGLRVDKFVNRRGDELTLKQLRKTQPEAFEAVE